MVKIKEKHQKMDDKNLFILSDYYADVREVGYKYGDIRTKNMALNDELRSLITLYYVQNNVTMFDISEDLGLMELTVYAVINDVVEILGLKFNNYYF